MLCLCKFSDASVGNGHVIVSLSVLLLVSVSTLLRTKMMVERTGIQTLDGGAKEQDVVERGGRRRLRLPERGSRWGGRLQPTTAQNSHLLCDALQHTAQNSNLAGYTLDQKEKEKLNLIPTDCSLSPPYISLHSTLIVHFFSSSASLLSAILSISL